MPAPDGAVHEPAPASAGGVFGAALPTAVTYAGLLATRGVAHGLLGPHEVTRLWDRHLLNCAVPWPTSAPEPACPGWSSPWCCRRRR
jgi:16S rRNA G527 N7-methylase RsmG